MEQIVLKLYVTGTTARSSRAIANLDAISKMLLGEKLEFSVINILEYPELAESEKILATPTLIKYFPLPMRRLIGDLSSREQVLEGLDIVVA